MRYALLILAILAASAPADAADLSYEDIIGCVQLNLRITEAERSAQGLEAELRELRARVEYLDADMAEAEAAIAKFEGRGDVDEANRNVKWYNESLAERGALAADYNARLGTYNASIEGAGALAANYNERCAGAYYAETDRARACADPRYSGALICGSK